MRGDKKGPSKTTVKQWATNVHELAGNMEMQKDFGQQMRESLRVEEEEHSQSLRERNAFFVDKIKSDIIFFANSLHEFVDLPDSSLTAQGATWDSYTYDVDQELKKVSSYIEVIGEHECITSLNSIISLLNMRDALLCKILRGVLYKKAVLDWDLHSHREYSDQKMADEFDHVVNLYTKQRGCVPAMLQEPLGSTVPPENGPYTNDQGKKTPMSLHEFSATLVSSLREFMSMDKALRAKHFGREVIITDTEESTGVSIAASSLRDEVTKWYKQWQAVDHELQVLKASRHAHWSHQVETLQQKVQSKEDQVRRIMREKSALETEITRLTIDRQERDQKLKEINERHTRMATQTVPKLEKLAELVDNSTDAVTVLKADAELLSSMFRKQVDLATLQTSHSQHLEKEVKRKADQLKMEQRKNQFMQAELSKKETLIIRAMAARHEMKDCYLQEKEKTKNKEEAVADSEVAVNEMKAFVEAQTMQNDLLHQDLRRTVSRIDELEQQNLFLTKKFRELLPDISPTLLDQFRFKPTLPLCGTTTS